MTRIPSLTTFPPDRELGQSERGGFGYLVLLAAAQKPPWQFHHQSGRNLYLQVRPAGGGGRDLLLTFEPMEQWLATSSSLETFAGPQLVSGKLERIVGPELCFRLHRLQGNA